MLKRNNTKGLSTIVATLLIILLTLVAVGVIWVVVKNVLKQGSEQVSFGKFTVDLKISKAGIINETDISVNVRRNPGKGELSGVLFIVYGKDNSEIVKYNISMQELEERNFQVILYVINTTIAEKVSIAPIFVSDSGKEFIGDIQDEYEFSKSSESVILTECGDGTREGSEECDDGNTNSGDGCDSDCNVENGWVCGMETPNVCFIPEEADNHTWGDELMVNGGFELGNLNNWITYGFYWVVGNHLEETSYALPQEGNYSVYYNWDSNAEYYIQQDVDLLDYIDYIGSGNAIVNASGWGVSSEYPNRDTTKIKIIFLDESKNIISTALDTGYVSNRAWWKAGVFKGSIPKNARYVRILGYTYENCVDCKSGSLDSFSVKVGYWE